MSVVEYSTMMSIDLDLILWYIGSIMIGNTCGVTRLYYLYAYDV